MIKQLFDLIYLIGLGLPLYLYSTTAYASRYTPSLFEQIRPLIFLGTALLLFLFLIKWLRQKLKKFDYRSLYPRLQPLDKIKITFIDENGKTITKCARITSIDGQKIVFENKKAHYECNSSNIKNIIKKSRIFCAFKMILFVGVCFTLRGALPNIYVTGARLYEKLICPEGKFLGSNGYCYDCDEKEDIEIICISGPYSTDNTAEHVRARCPQRRFDNDHTSYLPVSEDDIRFFLY